MAPAVGRIHRRSTFRALSRPDGRGRSGPVSVFFSRSTEGADRPAAAYAVGRRNGGAVARNRLRRRLREAVRAAAPDLRPGAYLLRATTTASALGYGQLCAAVRKAAQAAGEAGTQGGSPRRVAVGDGSGSAR